MASGHLPHGRFGPPTASTRTFWCYDLDSLDGSAKLDAKLLKDVDCEKMLKKTEDLCVDQSLHDTIVRLG